MASVYEIVTEQITKQLEKGIIPWRKPWVTAYPRSLRSQKEYRGINVILLASQGYVSPYWATFNQVNALGGRIRKDEHSTLITFWKKAPYTKRNVASGDDETRMGFILRFYRVFNLCQTEGIAEKLGLSTTGEGSARVADIEACECVVAGMRNRPTLETNGSRAFYNPLRDAVSMPAKGQFVGAEEYYSTLFHELAHSTGHTSRLNRWEGAANQFEFASESYSKEELIAEFSAAFLCGVTGIAPSTVENSAAYIQSWLRRLRNDSKLLVSAAAQAQKAADYIAGNTFQEETEGEQETSSDAVAA